MEPLDDSPDETTLQTARGIMKIDVDVSIMYSKGIIKEGDSPSRLNQARHLLALVDMLEHKLGCRGVLNNDTGYFGTDSYNTKDVPCSMCQAAPELLPSKEEYKEKIE